ncbi:hypothetical protein G7A66_07240 [Altererythrobacter sp. SALINAS58]|uniref:hypothetical protein n=1 Tax=Alteripontixanthobacter muriae TaxID=2705546 RepID=UPI0015761D1A|nr:hypothetical protein [Alteripontixanthobacter muriae]NTZ42884.1 hypothetical protein [Alteripontixanthobacter muriae]
MIMMKGRSFRMAGQKETAIGIATALASEHSPNPFPLSFRGQSLQEAADLVQLVVAECGDAGIKLARLELDPELFEVLEQRLIVPVRPDYRLQGSVRIFRFSA